MEEKIKVFLDSNILFSIAYTGKEKSRSYLIYEIQSIGNLEVYLSNLVCREAIFNIKIKKPERLILLNELIKKSKILADVLADIKHELLNSLPQNDRIILATAISNKLDYFITGNSNDFKNLYHKKIGKTLILKPIDFLYGNL
ncbi:MAG: PIN domain-containing protein [Nitrospiraceae bacterium]|nr:PIN domain-containing protein [Nitrospiraceae bacterium]